MQPRVVSNCSRAAGASHVAPRPPCPPHRRLAHSHHQQRAPRLHATAPEGCVLFELDGAVIDIHMDGHRVAFNKALANLGYEACVGSAECDVGTGMVYAPKCAQFTPPVYNDLLQGGDGSAEGLVKTYFDCMGWPTMLPTSERGLFTKKVCQTKSEVLTSMLKKDEVPLRPAVDEVVRAALDDSMYVGFIAGTQSDLAEEVVQSALRQLGPDMGPKVKVFHCVGSRAEERDSERESGEGLNSSALRGALQDASSREKARSASAFVRAIQDEEAASSLPMSLDVNLVASNRRRVPVELLAAVTAALGVRMASCLLLASSLSVVEAGCTAGFVTVAIPRKMAAQGSFPGVAAKMEGYGTGSATWPRLRGVLRSNGKGQKTA